MTVQVGTLSEDGSHYWDGEPWQWQPLWLRAEEVLEAAHVRFGVGAESAEYFGSGLLNQSWRIGDYVLRVSRADRSADQIAYEHTVVETLHRRLPEIVSPLSGLDGQTLQSWRARHLSLFPFVRGELGTSIPLDVRLDETAVMLARAHRVSLEHVRLPQRPGFQAADVRSEWIWPRLRTMLRAEVDAPGAADYFALFDDELARLDAWFDRLHTSGRPMTRAVVQGDTNPRNLIFSGERIVGVIDWDDCRVDPLLAAIAQEAFWPRVDPEAYWRTYLAAGGPLSPDDFELLGGFARLHAFAGLQWTDHGGHAGPYAIDRIREVAEAIVLMRGRVDLGSA